MKNQISVTRALAEIKKLDQEVQFLLNEVTYIKYKQKQAQFVGGVNAEEIKRQVKSNFDKTVAKIQRRRMLKSKIVLSNAETIVEINGEKMTVAEAIDRKNLIEMDKSFLRQLKGQYSSITNEVDRKTKSIQSEAENMATANFGSKQKADPAAYRKFVEEYVAAREFELIDPNNVAEQIEKLEKEINGFLMEVDFVLSESNALTKIEID